MSKGRLTVDWSYKIFRVIYVPREFLSIHNIRKSTKKVLRYLPLNFASCLLENIRFHVIQKVMPLSQLPVLKTPQPVATIYHFLMKKNKKTRHQLCWLKSSLHKYQLRHEFAAVFRSKILAGLQGSFFIISHYKFRISIKQYKYSNAFNRLLHEGAQLVSSQKNHLTWLTLTTHWGFCHSTGWGLIQTKHIINKSFWQLGSTHLKSMFKIAQVNLGSQIFSSCTKQVSPPIVTNPSNPWTICLRVTTNQTLKKQIKTAIPTFQTLENQSNNFWYLASYAKFVSYKNHHSSLDRSKLKICKWCAICTLKTGFHNLITYFEIFEAPLTFYLVAICHASEIYVWQIWFNFPQKGWIYRKTMEQNTSIQHLRHSNMLAGEWRSYYGFFIVPK